MPKNQYTRANAVRDFLIALAGLSAFVGVPLFFYLMSGFPEPWKTGFVAAIVVIWVVAGVGLLLNLRRNLTPVILTARGIQVGSNLIIPYDEILEVDPRPGKRAFRLNLQGRKTDVYLSKTGLDEPEFFVELGRHVVSFEAGDRPR